MNNLVIVGTQWGDEGKGKITDFLAQKADVIVRFQGGNNAGHTIKFQNQKYALHLLPSGILNPNCINVMSNGMVIDPRAFVEEYQRIQQPSTLYLSDRAHIVLPHHIMQDKQNEKTQNIGTTHKGIGPAYTEKALRRGLRVADFIGFNNKDVLKRILERFTLDKNKLNELVETYLSYAEFMKPFVRDTSKLLNEYIHEKKILFEGAQGVMLCIEHGTYPYVTSSSPTAASVPLNTGLAPWFIQGALGVMKAYTTRVGEGPLPSEIEGSLAHKIRVKGNEFGTTTGRPRRIGWLDLVQVNYAKSVSGLTSLSVTLLDVLTGLDEIKVVTSYQLDGKEIDFVPASISDYERCVPKFKVFKGWQEDIGAIQSYDDLPLNAKKYLTFIETFTGLEVSIVSVGPDRTQTLIKREIF